MPPSEHDPSTRPTTPNAAQDDAPAKACPRCGSGLMPLLVLALVAGIMVMPLTRWLAGGGSAGGQDEVSWVDGIEEAQASAAEQNRPVLLVFTDPSTCPPCRQMDRETWADAQTASFVTDRVIPVKLLPGMAGRHDAARRYGVQYLPTLVLTDAQGNPVARAEGRMGPRQLQQWLGRHTG